MTPTLVTVYGSGLRRRDIIETREFDTEEDADAWAKPRFGQPGVGDITYEPVKEPAAQREAPQLVSRDEYLHGPDRERR